MITIILNGDHHQIQDSSTVLQLLEELQLPVQGIALAINGSVVPKSQWTRLKLKNSDKIELITIAQGG